MRFLKFPIGKNYKFKNKKKKRKKERGKKIEKKPEKITTTTTTTIKKDKERKNLKTINANDLYWYITLICQGSYWMNTT